jgi:hypothetical protein
LIDNPWAWAALAAVIIFVLLLNYGLISALRRKPGAGEGALSRSLRAVSDARRAHDQQRADLDELHRRVAELDKPDE